MSSRTDDILSRAVAEAIARETARIADEEIAGIQQRVTDRVRQSIGGIATRVLDHVIFERAERELVIRVKIEDKSNG
ncbi:glucose-6-phosphate-specific signal transduction histidine kinase [Sphingomonas zeicaulis]|uniref:hypothetical protein n=1 Tax=Sphingomonas zeicaulis TaxID=1632740 RepID=UPI003D1BCE35